MLESRGEWAAAEPLLEVLLRRVDRADGRRHPRSADAAGEGDRGAQPARALRAYDDARAIAPAAPAPLRAAAELRFASQDWGEAAALFEELVRAHEATLGEALPDLYHRLGVAERRLHNHESAVAWFGKALERDPGHRPSREALAERHLGKGDYRRLGAGDAGPGGVGARRASGPPCTSGSATSTAIGWRTRCRRSPPTGARSGSRPSAALGAGEAGRALHRAQALAGGGGGAREAGRARAGAGARGGLLQQAARIERDELESPEKAVELLERALDDAPTLERLRRLEAMLHGGQAVEGAGPRLPHGGAAACPRRGPRP
jgi:tetratricopeptide (TPR) repeat protein